MKKLLILSLIIFGCKKAPSPEPTPIAPTPLVPEVYHTIEVDAINTSVPYATITVNWNLGTLNDSVYNYSGSSLHFLKSYSLTSDSILIYSSQFKNFTVRVDGILKASWSSVGLPKIIKIK